MRAAALCHVSDSYISEHLSALPQVCLGGHLHKFTLSIVRRRRPNHLLSCISPQLSASVLFSLILFLSSSSNISYCTLSFSCRRSRLRDTILSICSTYSCVTFSASASARAFRFSLHLLISDNIFCLYMSL